MDWSSLPWHILRCISSHLSDPEDFVHFRAVCPNWRTTVPRSCHPPFVPWVITSRDDCDDTDTVTFYSLSSGKLYAISVPELQGKRVAGYGTGYLLGIGNADDRLAVLVNPLTGESVSLPPLPESFHGAHTHGFVTDPDISGETDCLVVVYKTPNDREQSAVALWQPGDARTGWTMVRSDKFWWNMPYYKHRLAVHNNQMCMAMIHAEADTGMADMAWSPGMHDGHIAEYKDEILFTFRFEDYMPEAPYPACPLDEVWFGVYRMAGEAAGWVEAQDISEAMFFQSHESSFALHARGSLAALGGNSVYFLKWLYREEGSSEDDGNPFPYYVCKWSLEDGNAAVVKRLPGVWEMPARWFLPTLR